MVYFCSAPRIGNSKQGWVTEELHDPVEFLRQRNREIYSPAVANSFEYRVLSDEVEVNFYDHLREFANQSEIPVARRVIVVEARYKSDKTSHRFVEMPCHIRRTGPFTSEAVAG